MEGSSHRANALFTGHIYCDLDVRLIFDAFDQCGASSKTSDENFIGDRDLFLKSQETFRAYFGRHNSLYIFATPRF